MEARKKACCALFISPKLIALVMERLRGMGIGFIRSLHETDPQVQGMQGVDRTNDQEDVVWKKERRKEGERREGKRREGRRRKREGG